MATSAAERQETTSISEKRPSVKERLGSAARRGNIPIRMLVEVTSRCNLSCRHCYIPERVDPGLATEELKSLLSELADAGCLELSLTGGELFTRPDWFEIAKFARQKHFALRILTNGTLITEEMAEQLGSLHLLSLDMSIYGAKAETHDAATNAPGSFEKSTKALQVCRQRGISTRIKCLLMKDNASEAEEVIELAKGLDAGYLFDPCVTPKTDGDQAPLNHQIDEHDIFSVFSKLRKKHLSLLHETARVEREANRTGRSAPEPCDAGVSAGFIDARGDVYPCPQLLVNLGNVIDESIEHIWHSSEQVMRFRDLRVKTPHGCSDCKMAILCVRCPGLALLEDGDFLGPSSRACKTMEALEKLIDNQETAGEENARISLNT